MKRTIFILLFIIFICTILYLFVNNTTKLISTDSQIKNVIYTENIQNRNAITVEDNKNEINLTPQLEQIKQIQIYDIEEGYLTVPYNSKAEQHSYNWNNLSIDAKGYYSYSDDIYESKLGIDVSKFQGKIDWEKVKESGIEFAILRLGFRGYGEKGNLVLDTTFEENALEASKAGINIGVYFFSQAITETEAIEEAHYVLDKIKDKNITYPICFDLEKIKYDTARTDNLTSEEITKITLAFCKEIEKAGHTPIIYGNAKTFTTKMQLEELNNYQKWYADYQQTPLYPYEFDIWQYSETGKVDGISGNVDLNIQFIKKDK